MLTNINIRIEPELKEKIKNFAKAKGINMTSYIIVAVQEQMKKDLD